MDSGLLNSLVYDYLSSVGTKMAEKFKKETKAEALPSGSPTIQKMVEHFKETTPSRKRKLGMANGSAKKSKKDDSSSDDDDEEKAALPKTAPVEKVEESSSDDNSDEEEEAKPKKIPTPAKKVGKAVTPVKPVAAKKEESSSDNSESDEEEVAKPKKEAIPAKPIVKAVTPAKPVAAKKEDSSSDDSDSDDDKPAFTAASNKATPFKAPAKEESSEDSDSDDEEEKPAIKKTIAVPAKVTKEESSSDDSSEDEEDVKKPTLKPVAIQAKPTTVKKDDSSSDEDSSDKEKEKPAKKVEVKASAKKEESSDDSSDDSDDEEEVPVKKDKAPIEDDGGGMKMVNYIGKKEEDFKTPTKNNQSYGESESEEGRKIFIHNVGESSVYEDFQEKVETFGEITDFFNSGRGFAFITYSTSAEAQACIAAMDNTEVAGKTIQMNIARPRGSAPTPGTGGKSRTEAPLGCKLFVHGVSEETANSDLQAAFDEHGTVTDAYNTGKGFAFVTFSKAVEATAAMEALEGQEVCGRYITVTVSKPKVSGDTPRGGGRGGRGGGGGGRRNDQEGCKLFIHNVSEETSQDDLRNAFAAHGSVTDAYNSGRGFAFITYGSPAEAKTAMGALEGQEVCGRTIQCNIAKPKGEKSDGAGGGRGGRGGGGGRGGRGGRGGIQIGAGGGGGQNKKMSFD